MENGSSWTPLSFAGFYIFEALEVYAGAGALGSVHPGEAGGGLHCDPAAATCASTGHGVRKLIDGAICGVRVVSCDGVWRKECDPPQRPAPSRAGRWPQPQPDENQSNAPDSNVLDQIYRFELVRRIPTVEAGP